MTDDYDADEIAVVLTGTGINFYPDAESAEEIADRAGRVGDGFEERAEILGTLDEYADKVVEHVNGFDGDPKVSFRRAPRTRTRTTRRVE